jgi:hypothetical protein
MARVWYWRRRPRIAEPTMLTSVDVAEQQAEPRGVRIALRAAALMGQQHDRKIRPGRLAIQPADQAAQIDVLDGLVGNHREAGAALDLADQLGQIGAGVGVKARLLDQRLGHGGVPADRSQDHGTLGRCPRFHGPGSSSSGLPSPT